MYNSMGCTRQFPGVCAYLYLTFPSPRHYSSRPFCLGAERAEVYSMLSGNFQRPNLGSDELLWSDLIINNNSKTNNIIIWKRKIGWVYINTYYTIRITIRILITLYKRQILSFTSPSLISPNVHYQVRVCLNASRASVSVSPDIALLRHSESGLTRLSQVSRYYTTDGVVNGVWGGGVL